MTIGTIHSKDKLFFSVEIGTAKNDEAEYHMTTSAGQGSPIIRNVKTGKYFTINWSELIQLARDAGIDEED